MPPSRCCSDRSRSAAAVAVASGDGASFAAVGGERRRRVADEHAAAPAADVVASDVAFAVAVAGVVVELAGGLDEAEWAWTC